MSSIGTFVNIQTPVPVTLVPGQAGALQRRHVADGGVVTFKTNIDPFTLATLALEGPAGVGPALARVVDALLPRGAGRLAVLRALGNAGAARVAKRGVDAVSRL